MGHQACPNCGEGHKHTACSIKTTVSESPSVTGYVASLEKACLDIYMSYHASQVRKLAASVESAWSLGQEIWTKRQNKDAT